MLKTQEKRSRRKILEPFLTFLTFLSLFWHFDGIFNPKIDTIRAFFPQKQGTLFDFQKRAGEVSPSPSSHASHAPALWYKVFYIPQLLVFSLFNSLYNCPISSSFWGAALMTMKHLLDGTYFDLSLNQSSGYKREVLIRGKRLFETWHLLEEIGYVH